MKKIKRPSSRQPLPKHAKLVYKGALFDVLQWRQKLYNGAFALYEKARRADTIAILAVTQDKKILVIREQQAGSKKVWELPGGRVDGGETPMQAAQRELLEETGYQAKKLKLWYSTLPFSQMDWVIHTFVATGCKKIQPQRLDPGEKITVHKVFWQKFTQLVLARKLRNPEIAIRLLQAKLQAKKMRALKNLLEL